MARRTRWTHAVWAAPLALGGLVQLGLKADEVVSSGAGVAQDDLATLLAHLAVVLVVRLIAVAIVLAWDFKETPSCPTCDRNSCANRSVVIMRRSPFFFFLAGRPRLFFLMRPELSERTEELWTLESSCSDSSSSMSSLWWREQVGDGGEKQQQWS